MDKLVKQYLETVDTKAPVFIIDFLMFEALLNLKIDVSIMDTDIARLYMPCGTRLFTMSFEEKRQGIELIVDDDLNYEAWVWTVNQKPKLIASHDSISGRMRNMTSSPNEEVQNMLDCAVHGNKCMLYLLKIAPDVRQGFKAVVSKNPKKSKSRPAYSVLNVFDRKQYSYDEEGAGTRISPRAHVRRGHLHRYHTRDGMITKFIKPIFVLGGNEYTPRMAR